MHSKLSNDTIEFLLDVQITSSNIYLEDANYCYENLLLETNEYQFNIGFRFARKFNKHVIYSEIADKLSKASHYTNKQITDSIVLLFSLSPKEIRNVSLIENYFSLIQSCRLKQYMFFIGQQREKIYQLKFRDFTVGPIDFEKFSDFIRNHSNSDFADKYKESLSNGVGIEIKYFEIRVLDVFKWMTFINDGDLNLDVREREIINFYLSSISNYYNDDFKRKYLKQQEFINSYFGIYYPLEIFEMAGYTQVNIFYGFVENVKNGWVLPMDIKISEVYFPDPRILELVNNYLAKNENNIYQANGEFSRYLDTICSLFSSAEKHITVGKYSNAFIDFFVGLDFLLAPDTEKSKKLKQRVSMLVHKGLSSLFLEQLIKMDRLYDIRSLYVHKGKEVEEIDLIELRNVSRIVLAALLEMHKESLKNKRITYNNWLFNIDNLIQNYYKGKSLSPNEMAMIGIKNYKFILQSSLTNYSI